LSGARGLIVAKQPIYTDHGPISGIVYQKQMIKKRIKPILFQPGCMINQSAIAAQLFHEYIVSQSLRCTQLIGGVRELGAKLWSMVKGHGSQGVLRSNTGVLKSRGWIGNDGPYRSTQPKGVLTIWKPHSWINNQDQFDTGAINNNLPNLLKINRYPISDVRLHLAHAPIRLFRVTHQNPRFK